MTYPLPHSRARTLLCSPSQSKCQTCSPTVCNAAQETSWTKPLGISLDLRQMGTPQRSPIGRDLTVLWKIKFWLHPQNPSNKSLTTSLYQLFHQIRKPPDFHCYPSDKDWQLFSKHQNKRLDVVKPENFYEGCFKKCISALTDQRLDSDLCRAWALWSSNSLSHMHSSYYSNKPISPAV